MCSMYEGTYKKLILTHSKSKSVECSTTTIAQYYYQFHYYRHINTQKRKGK